MTDRELLQQVLDAWQDHWVNDNQSALLETIRANCAKEIYNCARCSEREWQGLTEEEIREGNRESWVTTQAWQSAVWWAEEKLKEKNT